MDRGDRRAQARRLHRLERQTSPTLRNWGKPDARHARKLRKNVVLRCGWGRLLFAHTFDTAQRLTAELRREAPGRRDIALYLREPHVALAAAPHALFLDPSHTYRIWLNEYHPSARRPRGLRIRPVRRRADVDAINRIYAARGMVPADGEFVWTKRNSRSLIHLVAEDVKSKDVVGTVTGVDHVRTFGDPEQGSSLWCLAVDPRCSLPGVGEALVRYLCEYFQARSRAFMDLSVMHDNAQAIALYEKLGFQRVPVFCLKHKNPWNEPLFSTPAARVKMNPYAEIIVREARRRGITVDVLDADMGLFRLSFGGRSVVCRESLTDVTSAVALTICDDKALTHKWLRRARLSTPAHALAGPDADNAAFLRRHKRVVVKPRRGEQGRGISVDVRRAADLKRAVEAARAVCPDVLIERLIPGIDLRVVVINYRVVAAAERRPPEITGTGQARVRTLIEKQSRRRAAATAGESRIPLDDETRRCVAVAGYELDDVLPAGEVLRVRRAANLHSGGTIHDVTADLHPDLRDAAERAAKALRIPVVGLDFIVDAVDRPAYHILEANERVGLANHEPQPTAERFIDLLFPQSAGTAPARGDL